jgi:aminopeptidase N
VGSPRQPRWSIKQLTCLFLFMTGAASVCAGAGASARGDRVVLPDNVTPAHYDLELTPNVAAATFTGLVRIRVDVHRSSRDIELNAGNLKFSSVRISGVPSTPGVSFDAAQQTVTLHFATPVSAGRHLLLIRYSGLINSTGSGLFHVDYQGVTERRRALYTQLENAYARLMFPCWDEPNRKATFTLTVTAPQADMTVSNMPVAHVDKLPGGLARTRFQTTPRMSTYLLFLGLGDFERISRRVNGVDVGVVFKRGDAALARFALDVATQLLPYYEDYFGIRYPLPKLDLICGPGRSQDFGAMENWGAIFGFDHYFLLDPLNSTQADRTDTYTYIAHEVAHLWFGDLVTMDWWNDLWLNESFAEWMMYKATDHFHPEWDVWLLAMADRENAMDLDAAIGTHPVIMPIADVLKADDGFDTITYDKGMSVVHMLEQQVGEGAFRDAIRRYIRAHAYGNAVTEDLWRELDRNSPHPIAPIAHEFTLQAGVPLIRVSAGGGIRLQQERFATDASGSSAIWHVPVVVQAQDGAAWRGIVSADAPVQLPLLTASGMVVNAGQVGYYRTLYAPELIASLAARFRSLQPVDQLGELMDAEALGKARYEPLPDVLELARQVDSGMKAPVQSTVAQILTDIAAFYRDRNGEAAYQIYARKIIGKLLAALGWNATSAENPDAGALRAALIAALGDLDDEQTLSWARGRFDEYVRNPASISRELRAVVLKIVATHADAAQWAQLHALAMSAHGDVDRDKLYQNLGLARDPGLAVQALSLTLGDELEPTSKPNLLRSIAVSHPDLTFAFALEHRDQVASWVEPDVRDLFPAYLLGSSVDPAAIERLKSYIDAHVAPAARGPALAIQSRIAASVKIRTQRLPQIDAWLRTQ